MNSAPRQLEFADATADASAYPIISGGGEVVLDTIAIEALSRHQRDRRLPGQR